MSLGVALSRMGQGEEAQEHLSLAAHGYSRQVQKKPNSLLALERLGDTYAAMGRWEDAGQTFVRSLPMEPGKMENHLKASQSLEVQGRVEESLDVIDGAIAVMSRLGRNEEVEQLRQYRQKVTDRHPQQR